MEAITNFLYWLDDLLWGNAMTVIVVGTGILLSLRFGFAYQRRIGFNFKNTFAKMFDKGEGEGTISGFRAACTALANTVGTGNISGVATAIVSGGPGALVWMWVSAFFGMSTKACEKSVNYAFGDTERNRKMMPIYIVYFMLPCVIFYNIEAEALWAFTDILSALYVCITVFIIVAKRKEIFRLFDDFWNRYLPAKEAGENPPYVTFDCKEQD